MKTNRQLLFILLAGLAVLLPGSWSLPLIDRDEPRFSRATVEMIDRSEWVIPYLNDEYRFDKPPFTYWAMRIGYTVCGQNELGARFHTIAFSLLTAWVLFAFGTRLRNANTGTLAALMFLFSMQVVQHGRAAVADMPMVFAIAWSLYLIHKLLDAPTRKDAWLLMAALTLGFYAKGPIAWAVPLLALLLFRWVLWRKPESWSPLRLQRSIPCVIALLALWGIPALIKTDGLFWDIGMGKHVIERGQDPMNGRDRFIGFYFLTAILSLFPWSAGAGTLISSLKQNWNRDNAFLLAWFLSPVLIFSLYATQLPHYTLPGFGGFFLLLAIAMHDGVEKKRWHAVVRTTVNGIWLLLVLVLAFIALQIPIANARYGVLGFAILAFGLYIAGQRLWIPAAVVMGIGTIMAGSFLRPLLPAIQLKEDFSTLPAQTAVTMSEYFEPSIIFYSDRTWGKIPPEEAEAWMRQDGPRMLILLEQELKFDKLLSWVMEGAEGEPKSKDRRERNAGFQFGDANVQLIEGMNPARSSWVRLRVITRNLP